MNRLATLFSIRSGEGRLAGLLVLLMLATALGASIGVSGIEALFFARFGVDYLPVIFMVQGVLTLIVTLSVSAVLGGRSRNLIYTFMPLLMAAILVGERFAAGLPWFLPVMWLLKELMNALMGLFVWGVASALCDTRQAKRLYPLFNAGRILGSVVGGLGTGWLVGLIGAENLLLVWAATLGLAFLVTRALLGTQAVSSTGKAASRRGRSPSFVHEVQQGYQFVRGSALMRWISLAAILFSALYFSLALPFSKAVTENFASAEDIAGFLGLFNGLSTAAAFVASLFVANRLYARFGIMNAILALPIIYLVGFGVLAVAPVFSALIAYKFIQMFWLAGMADSAYQAMFNAVPGDRRDQVRAFIDGVPSQTGTFIAGFILIIGEQRLESQQLYLIGLGLALVCTLVIWRAGRAYSTALVAALKAGQPQLFGHESYAFGLLQRDATATEIAVAGVSSPDPATRRVAVEVLGGLIAPKATEALVGALGDSDAMVRASALRALGNAKAQAALLDMAACLRDPDPDTRAQAVDSISQLAGFPAGLRAHVQPLLNDAEANVRARAAVALLRLGPNVEAKEMLRTMAALGEAEERVEALTALGDWGDAEAFQLVAAELDDEQAPAPVRRAAARALVACGPDAAPTLVRALGAEDRMVRETVAVALGQLGRPALEATVAALFDKRTEHGAVHALEYLPAQAAPEPIRRYARERAAQALQYHGWWSDIRLGPDDERLKLLADSLHDQAVHEATHALRALHVLSDRETIAVALDNLRSRNASQRANALESLESVRETAIVRPVLKVWEAGAESAPPRTDGQWERTLAATLDSGEAWIRACAALAAGAGDTGLFDQKLKTLADSDSDAAVREAAARTLAGGAMDTLATLSLMERILFCRRVPLLADLSSAELKQVAAIASEQFFADGDVIAEQGEMGNEMFVIVSGEVCVRVGEKEVARRKVGEAVGELALITQEPRMATLVAAGEVRTLCMDRKSFEGLLRERPETSLAVIRVLAARLKEMTR